MDINPYLMFKGDCEAAFKFYEKVLGGKIEMMLRHRGSPVEEHTPPERLDQILHARLVAGSAVLMGSDSPPERYPGENGFFVSIRVDSVKEAERIFAALSEGAIVLMPMGETFWAERFGMLRDRFGVNWMVNLEKTQ